MGQLKTDLSLFPPKKAAKEIFSRMMNESKLQGRSALRIPKYKAAKMSSRDHVMMALSCVRRMMRYEFEVAEEGMLRYDSIINGDHS